LRETCSAGAPSSPTFFVITCHVSRLNTAIC
jgi:hypothetical protein